MSDDARPFFDLAQRLLHRLEDARYDQATGQVLLPCPIDNAEASIEAYANDFGDAIECTGGCDPDDVERGLRYLASALPRLCRSRERRVADTRFEHARSCLRCQRCTDALRKSTGVLQDMFGTVSLGQDAEEWTPTSLLDAPPQTPPTILRVGNRYLVRAGKIYLIHGAQASAKTPLCYIAVVEQVKAGHLALISDHEMGASDAAALLRQLGLSDVEIEDGVLYDLEPGPNVPAKRRALARAIEEQQERTGRQLTLSVIDSLTESMSTVPGSDDNNAQDVMTWFNSLPKWLAQLGAAVLVIDHSGVNHSERPSGSHKKREVPQGHYWIKNVVAFSRDHDRSYSEIIQQKGRDGVGMKGEIVGQIRTRLGGSFVVVPPTSAAPPNNIMTLPLNAQPARSTDDDVLVDLRKAGPAGVAKTPLVGDGAAGVYRRAALDRLVGSTPPKAIVRKVGRFQMCWAAELAPSAVSVSGPSAS